MVYLLIATARKNKMSKIKDVYETYLCDFCKESKMFSCEESWEVLDDGQDRCISCLIKHKNKALELLEEFRITNRHIDKFLNENGK